MNLNKSDNASNAGNQQETSFVSSNLINHKWGILRDYTPDTVKLSVEKSDVLKMVLDSYKNPSKYISSTQLNLR